MNCFLRDEDLPKVVSVVNKNGLEEWIVMGLAVQAVINELNLL